MFTIKIIHDGKEYTDFEDAIFAATVNGVRKSMEKKLEPFHDEIIREGGQIALEIGGTTLETFKGQLRISGISAELKEKILEAVK